MTQIIKNVDILFGIELQVIKNGIIVINEHGKIEKIGKNLDEITHDVHSNSKKEYEKSNIIDAEGFMIIPGLINSHTHIGDAIGKDICADSDIDKRINPRQSIKKTLLEKTEKEQLRLMIKNTAISMLHKGITTFIDFREGGIEGVKLLRSAIKDIPIKSVILGRIDDLEWDESNRNNNKMQSDNQDPIKRNEENDIVNKGKTILDLCDGFGISGSNENSDKMLILYNKIIKEKVTGEKMGNRKPLVAIHAAEAPKTVTESLKNYNQTEIERTIYQLNPDVYIHVTNPTKNDLDLLHFHRKGIVICPRANGILGAGFVPLEKMLKLDFNIAIGTDNIMLNSPDIFREMDFLIKSQRALNKDNSCIDGKMVLKMATVNGGKIFNLNTGIIEKGYSADLLFIDKYDIDLYPIHDPWMSIVQRCSERQIKAVMVNGKFVLEKTRIN